MTSQAHENDALIVRKMSFRAGSFDLLRLTAALMVLGNVPADVELRGAALLALSR